MTLACWPPGPEERLVRSSISASGIARRSSIRSSSATAQPAPSSGMWRSRWSAIVCRTQRCVSASAIR